MDSYKFLEQNNYNKELKVFNKKNESEFLTELLEDFLEAQPQPDEPEEHDIADHETEELLSELSDRFGGDKGDLLYRAMKATDSLVNCEKIKFLLENIDNIPLEKLENIIL